VLISISVSGLMIFGMALFSLLGQSTDSPTFGISVITLMISGLVWIVGGLIWLRDTTDTLDPAAS
jgi:hypothetical protein